MLAAVSLAAAFPAIANAHEGYGRGSDGGYGNLRQEFQHLYAGVQHGLSDGSYSRREARQFYRAIESLRGRLDFYRNNDGYLSGWERSDLRRRIQRLHANMHDAHANGHAERDYGYYDDRAYGDYRDQDSYGRDRDGYGDDYRGPYRDDRRR
jgi:hypothetical protein